MNGKRIGNFLHEDISRATVLVKLKDEFENEREVPFSFRGETGEYGEHCLLYLDKETAEALSSIEALQNPYRESDVKNVYRFHKEEIYVESEDDVYVEK